MAGQAGLDFLSEMVMGNQNKKKKKKRILIILCGRNPSGSESFRDCYFSTTIAYDARNTLRTPNNP